MLYIPRTHMGTRKEIINGLLREAGDIMHDGFMREFAKNRELDRIFLGLKKLDIMLLIGDEEDEGYLLGREMSKPHTPSRCTQENGHVSTISRR